MNHQNDKNIAARLKESGLSDADQQFWLSRIQAAPVETQPHIIEFLATVPGGAEWLRAIQEEKEQALFTGDRELWRKVLKDEASVIPS